MADRSEAHKYLMAHAGSALSDARPEIDLGLACLAGTLYEGFLEILSSRNGFYAFDNALHVFSTDRLVAESSIATWNEEGLWRDAYGGLADGCLFFAEDIFGGQFCIKESAVHSFDPETGELTFLADAISGWVEVLVSDYRSLTGSSIAVQWQRINGQLPVGKRLLPKVPFVLGGDFSIGNLYEAESVAGMRARGKLATQIGGLPDGTKIRLNIRD